METNRLKQFCIVVETGGLTQASVLLGISHGGLSKSLKVLEEELGVKLFRPRGRGLQLTDDGERVYQRARPLLRMVEHLADKETTDSLVLRVGALEAFTHSFLPRFLATDFPDRKLELHQMQQGELEDALRKKELDLGITYFPMPREEIEYLKIKRTQLRTFARGDNVQFSSELSFAVPMRAHGPEQLDNADHDGWPEHFQERRGQFEVNNLSTAMQYVLEHQAAIFIPEFVADHYNHYLKKSFQLNPVKMPTEMVAVYRDIYIAIRKTSEEGTEVKRVAKLIRKYCN